MTIIDAERLISFGSEHADAKTAVQGWLTVAKNAKWQCFIDVKKAFPATDNGVRVSSGGRVEVFNVGGNKYRLVVRIVYKAEMIYVLEVMTHPDYSKDHWKKRW